MTFEEKRERAGQYERVAQRILDHLVKIDVVKYTRQCFPEDTLDAIKGRILHILVSDDPALAAVPASRSWDGKTMVREMGINGYVLLLNLEEAKLRLTKNGEGSGRPLELPVSYAEAAKLVHGECIDCRVSVLTQFRYRSRLGWREVVGDLGEKYDVYTLVQ